MESNPSVPKKFPYLSMIFPENPNIKLETPNLIHFQQSSDFLPPPPDNTNFLCHNNLHRFQNHPLNGANHHPSFVMEGSSSINKFSMIPRPHSTNSYKVAHRCRHLATNCYPMALTPNRNQIGAMHGYLQSGKGFCDISHKIPLQSGINSQPKRGLSLSPSLFPHALVPIKPRFQDELSCFPGIGNSQWEIGQKVAGDNNQHNAATDLFKTQWTPVDDRNLVELVKRFGPKKWTEIGKILNGRTGKQCRHRWLNHLRPNIRTDSWSEEEDKILIEAHKEVGNKWVEIASRLPGRTENAVKNHWNSTKRGQISKRQNKQNSSSKGTVLESYIREVIAAEEVEKELMKSTTKMNIRNDQDRNNNDLGFTCVHNEHSKGDFSSENWATQYEVGYVPVTLNADGTASMCVGECSIMDLEVARNMVLEVPIKKEIDFMGIGHRNP